MKAGIQRFFSCLLLVILLCSTVIECFPPMKAYANDSAKNVDGYLQPIEKPNTSAIKISNADELKKIADDMYGSYVLTADIDLSEIENWDPIGTSSAPFKGVFDGQGHTIANMRRNTSATEASLRMAFISGLFGVCDGAYIKNVNLESASISVTSDSSYSFSGGIDSENGHYAGLLAAYLSNGGIIYNCRASGKITMSQTSEGAPKPFYAGGLVGWLSESGISDSYISSGIFSASSTSSTGDKSFVVAAGGLAGKVTGDSKLSRVYNSADVTANVTGGGNAFSGGLVGISYDASCQLINAYNKGTIISKPATSMTLTDATGCAGGIAGKYNGLVENCYNAGSVNAQMSDGSWGDCFCNGLWRGNCR